jgi:hypothetical protein
MLPAGAELAASAGASLGIGDFYRASSEQALVRCG